VDRVANASEEAKEGARVCVNGAIEQIKSARLEGDAGFVIDSLE